MKSCLFPLLVAGLCGCQKDEPAVEKAAWELSFSSSVETVDLGTLSYLDVAVPVDVTLTNTSGLALTFADMAIEGTGASLFTLVDPPAAGTFLADGASVSFSVTATTGMSWRTGWYSPTLVVTAGQEAGGEPKTWSLPALLKIRCDLDGDGQDATECGGTDCNDDHAPEIRVGETDVCDGLDNDCDGAIDEDADIPWYRDEDGDTYGAVGTSDIVFSCLDLVDGYSPEATDCNDLDPLIGPNAPERCNDIDDDCNGKADDGEVTDPTTWYRDADGDGWGGSETTATCDMPSGYVVDNGDCDDVNFWINPRSPEHCDGLDEDCDGEVDESAINGKRYYIDADGDGFGDAATSLIDCGSPTGYVEDATDCDDTSAAVNPGAPDLCAGDADGVDNDCNGVVDNEDEARTFYLDSDGDGYGDAMHALVTCRTTPTGYVTDNRDCDDARDTVHPSAAESCNDGMDDDCDDDVDCDDSDCAGVMPCSLDLAAADAKLVGEVGGDRAGVAASAAGDVDGDGYDDVFIGANGENTGGSDAGAAYLVFGPTDGTIDLGTADAKLIGEGPDDQAGGAVGRAGDTNGDGFDDLLVGAVGNDMGGSGSGIVYLVMGPPAESVELDLAELRMRGTSAGDAAGTSVAGLGDTDGDGLDDLLVGAPGADFAATDAGAAYLVLGGRSGYASLGTADARLLGGTASEAAGSTVAAAGDINSDGFADVLVAASGADDAATDGGSIYIVLGPVGGDVYLSEAEFRFSDADASDAMQHAAIGDLNGDGVLDLLAGAEGNDDGGASSGAVFALLGPLDGASTTKAVDDMLSGDAGTDYAGGAIAIPGDLDKDGNEEALVGAYNATFGSVRAGSSWVLSWPWTGTKLSDAGIPIGGENSGDRAGDAVSGAGDADGDGVMDLLIGAPYEDAGGSSAGSAYLVLGSNF